MRLPCATQTHSRLIGVQVSGYLGSDAGKWTHEFWDIATRLRHDTHELRALALLHEQPEDIILAVYEAHPLLASKVPLSTQLQTLPRLAHAAACLHAVKAPSKSEPDCETLLGPYVEVDMTEAWIAMAVVDVLPQVLRHRPDTVVHLRPPAVTQRPHDAEAHVLGALAALAALRGLTIACNEGWSCTIEGTSVPQSAWLQCSVAGEPQLPSALCGLSSLERLRVDGMRVCQPAEQMGWAGRALQPLLAGCPQLTLLQLSNCQLRACDFETLRPTMTAMSGLRDLCLQAEASDGVTAPVCATLCTLPRLTKLCLSGLGLPSRTELWDAVARVSSLQQIVVIYSDFWQSACAPVPGLAQLTALTKLFIDEVSHLMARAQHQCCRSYCGCSSWS